MGELSECLGPNLCSTFGAAPQRELGKCWSTVKKDNGKLSEPISSLRTRPCQYEMKYCVIISRIMTSFAIELQQTKRN